jgi:hypothetical protein
MDIRTVRAYRSGDVFLPDGQSLGGTPVRLFSGLNRLSAQLIGEANPWVVFDPGASGGRTLYLGDGTNIDTRIVRSAAGVMGVSGHQGARANTGGTIAAGAQADVALTWPNAFPDTNYTIAVSAGINDATSRNAPSVMIREETKTASGFTVRVTNNTAATAVTIYVEALAIHD